MIGPFFVSVSDTCSYPTWVKIKLCKTNVKIWWLQDIEYAVNKTCVSVFLFYLFCN